MTNFQKKTKKLQNCLFDKNAKNGQKNLNCVILRWKTSENESAGGGQAMG